MHNLHKLRQITCPDLPPAILHRTKLLNMFQQAIASSGQEKRNKLIVVSAPIGYGKTTLLVDFADHTNIGCCWYFLDSADNDVQKFARTLIASIQQSFPQFGKSLEKRWKQMQEANISEVNNWDNLNKLIGEIISAIKTDIQEQIAIFLCNYHEVQANEDIRFVVDGLLCNLPQNCTLVIESRTVPDLNLVPLMAFRQLLIVKSESLRFSTDEIQALARLQQLAPLDDEEIKQTVTTFDGWITGILLGTRLGNKQFFSSHLEGTQGKPATRQNWTILFSFLVQEVFKSEQESYTFLRETSILEQIVPSFCDTLLEITDSENRLTYTEQQGLFVSRCGEDEQVIYTVHPLLRDLLYTELAKENTERKQTLHLRAANLYLLQQDYKQAVIHALAAAAYDFAVNIVVTASKYLLVQGCVEDLEHWINIFPQTVVADHWQLLILQAKIYLYKYEYGSARPLLEQVYNHFERQSEEVDPDLAPLERAEVLIAYSSVPFQDGDYTRVQDLCQQALTLLPVDEKELHVQACEYIGICASLQSDHLNSIVQMQRALHIWGHPTETQQMASLHSGLANAYSCLGNIVLAKHHWTRAMIIYEHIGDIRGKINNLIWMARLKQNKGLLCEAETMLNNISEMARTECFLSGEAYVLLSLSELYLQQQLFDKALVTAEDGLSLARQIEDNYLVNHLLCTLALAYAFTGDPNTALFLVEETHVKSTKRSSYETFYYELTQGTVLLCQGQYQAALSSLLMLEQRLQQTEHDVLKIIIAVRLAACQYTLHDLKTATRAMVRAITLATQSNNEHILQVEVRYFPKLQEIIHILPEQCRLPVCWTEATDNVPEKPSVSKPIQVSVDKSRLSILAFEEPAIIIDQNPVTHWRMARAMELCFFLLDYGRPIRKEQIITALWPEIDDHTDQTLRSMIHYLRKAIGEECLVYNNGTYQLDLASLYGKNYQYDVAEFELHYKQGQEALELKDDDATEQYFQQTIALYRGKYLQPFYSDWCIPRRDELCRYYMSARYELALIAWRKEQIDESIHHWEHILALDECYEEAYYGLMKCYMRLGKRYLAIQQFQRCSNILQKELSILPRPSMQKLYQRLIST